MSEEMDLKMVSYRKKLDSEELLLKMEFLPSPIEMPMNRIRTEFTKDINNYLVVQLNGDKVISLLDKRSETRFPIDSLMIVCHAVRLI